MLHIERSGKDLPLGVHWYRQDFRTLCLETSSRLCLTSTRPCSVLSDHANELVPHRRILEATKEVCGQRSRPALTHPTHCHTKMIRFDNDSDSKRTEYIHSRMSHIFRKTFLDLQPPGEDLDETRKLGQPYDCLVWQVPNVYLRFD